MQVFDQLRFEAGLGALKIGVFNAQDEVAALTPRKEPVIQGRARVAHVQQSGGGRSKAHANLIRGHNIADHNRLQDLKV